jgi:hypothetical protein
MKKYKLRENGQKKPKTGCIPSGIANFFNGYIGK